MIEFSEAELNIFKIIKDYAISLDPKVTPRLAGGFVRDKIMGIKSHDVDIALDTASGYNFALGLCEKLEIDPKVHKIQANPIKSKHLETALINICGFSIDFVHLRSETYTNTRIPKIKIGTAEEDAFRRDITINSLFYNLISDEIEDFTGRGLADIYNGVIDTPLDPEVTLFDDPLRILRIFRFRSKFLFNISERICKAIKSPIVREALGKKISKERIGNEIFRMLEYENGYLGMVEIIKYDCDRLIFSPKSDLKTDPDLALSFYNEYTKIKNYIYSIKKDVFINDKLILLYIYLQFFINLKIDFGKKEEFVNVLILKESLKSSKQMYMAILKIEETIQYLKTTDNIDSIDAVLEGYELWLESTIIAYIHTKNIKFYNIIENVIKDNQEKAISSNPLLMVIT